MEENFLDEYRFAEAFTEEAESKALGTEAHKNGLAEHRIPSVTINRILNQIDPGLSKRMPCIWPIVGSAQKPGTTNGCYATPRGILLR